MPDKTTISWEFLTRSHRSRRVLWLAAPIILSNIAVPLVGIVDTAVMGRMAEPRYMGAVAIGAIIFSSVFWLFGFLKMGTGGLVAQALGSASADSDSHAATLQGAGDSTHASDSGASLIDSTIYRALAIAAAIGFLIILLQWPIGVGALKAFDVSDQVKTLAYDYFAIRIYAAPATLMVYSLLGAFIGLQQMRAVLVLQLILNLGNIALTILFFSAFDGGIKGVALATVIAEYASLAYGLYRLQQVRSLWPLKIPLGTILDTAALARLLQVNANLFVRTLCLTFSFYWLTRSGAKISEMTLAANSILIHMVHFSAHALDGFAHAAETLCGNAYGKAITTKNRLLKQGDKPSENASSEFRMAVILTCFWGYVFGLLISIIYLLFGTDIIAMMTTQADVREYAERWLWWIILSPLIGVGGFMLDGIYIGVTHTRDMRNAMLLSAAIFLVANLILVQLYGNTGVWISYFILMIARALTLYRTYPRIINKLDQ